MLAGVFRYAGGKSVHRRFSRGQAGIAPYPKSKYNSAFRI